MLYYRNYNSPLGEITIVSDLNSIRGVYFINQKYYLANLNEELQEDKELEILNKATFWLDEYFKGHNPSLQGISLNPHGTDFQILVWYFLQSIPYGKIVTYKDITKLVESKLNKKMSSQAVGNAVSRNPISIMIPCHRVVGSNGSLTGYAGGVDIKEKLLQLENKNIKLKSNS